jgi:hypothetical protein
MLSSCVQRIGVIRCVLVGFSSFQTAASCCHLSELGSLLFLLEGEPYGVVVAVQWAFLIQQVLDQLDLLNSQHGFIKSPEGWKKSANCNARAQVQRDGNMGPLLENYRKPIETQ